MTTVDVGGYTVEVHVTGGDDPPVVLVASMGAPGTAWRTATDLLTTHPRLITYDRPGIGASPARPAPNPPLPYSAFAAELGVMLKRLGIVDSVVAVGHSFGSLIVRMLAAQHPDLVAGAVHVDGSLPRLAVWAGAESLVDGTEPHATEVNAVAGKDEVDTMPLLTLPSVVLTRTPGRWQDPPPAPAIDREWQDTQAGLARQIGAHLVVATNSGHEMLREAPDLVAYAIDAVVHAVRTRQSQAALDPGRLAAVGGRYVAADPLGGCW
ncbi:MAG TPA: alpha/beta hydrolase [Rugosimonospora sp.]|nr:alpha/beta hydrolase [Rugosimonospora sp.]